MLDRGDRRKRLVHGSLTALLKVSGLTVLIVSIGIVSFSEGGGGFWIESIYVGVVPGTGLIVKVSFSLSPPFYQTLMN